MTSDSGAPATVPAWSGPPPLPAPPVLPRTGLSWSAVTVDWVLALGLLLMFSTLAVVGVMVPGLLRMHGEGGSPDPDTDQLMQQLLPEITVAAILAMLLTAIMVWAIRRNTLRGPAPAMSTGRAYLLALLAGAAIQGAALALGWLLARFDSGLSPSNVEPLVALSRSTPWLAAIMVVLVGPLAEELLFRHVLLRRFLLAGQAGLGLVLTSVLFSLLHEPVPGEQGLLAWLGSLAVYTGMGIAFGIVYLRTGRLGAAFVAHAACNLLALAALAYSTS